jgi:hypothetical protein
MKMSDRAPFIRTSAIALTCSLVGLWWVLMWAPAKDAELFAEQDYIEECRKAGGTPVHWDGEIECRQLRDKTPHRKIRP